METQQKWPSITITIDKQGRITKMMPSNGVRYNRLTGFYECEYQGKRYEYHPDVRFLREEEEEGR